MKYVVFIFFAVGCCNKAKLITENTPKSDCEKLLRDLGSMVKNSHGVLTIIDSKNLDISKYDNWDDEKLMLAAIPSDDKGQRYYEWLSLAEKLNTLKGCDKLTKETIEQYLGELYTTSIKGHIIKYALYYGPRCPLPEQGYVTPENIWLECYCLHIYIDENDNFLKAKRSDFGGNWQ